MSNIENWKKFQDAYKRAFKVNIEDYINLINNNNGLDIFFDITVNKLLSNLNKENFIEDNQDLYSKFSSWTLSILSKISITF